MSLLFVCQGNTCRSAVAERLVSAWAAEDARASIGGIGSAGLGAREGQPLHPLSAEALQELGGVPGEFRSRPFVPALAEDAGLVLTMTERQRRSVLEAAPLGLRRTFALTEAAALLELADLTGLDTLAARERPAELGRRLHEARARRPAAQWSDIEDPLGKRPSAHRNAAHRIADALRPLADVLFAPSTSRPGASPRRLAAATRDDL